MASRVLRNDSETEISVFSFERRRPRRGKKRHTTLRWRGNVEHACDMEPRRAPR